MISITPATMGDVEQVRARNQELFYHDSQFDTSLEVTWPKKNKKYYVDAIKSKNALVLVAKDERTVIGYLIGSMIAVEKWRTVKKIAELENMLIVKEYRGKGIGTQLIQAFLVWAKKKKAERVKVVASSQNKGAIQSYMKNGFREYNLVMEKQL